MSVKSALAAGEQLCQPHSEVGEPRAVASFHVVDPKACGGVTQDHCPRVSVLPQGHLILATFTLIFFPT